VLTWHNDNARTGQALNETVLTPASVNSTSFGKLFTLPADGKVNAEPLYVSALSIGGVQHNVVYVVTEHDTVFAYDADTGTMLWQKSMLASGERTADDHGCGQITPEIGITATPVIDRNMGASGTMYLVAMSRAGDAEHQRLHALDLLTGNEQTGSPVEIQASVPGTGDGSSGGTVTFNPGQHVSRPALLSVNGVVYTFWGSHCDFRPYSGWIIGYNGTTLAQQGVFDTVPNGNEAAIWQSAAGPAADSAGNIYSIIGNGSFDTTLDGNGFPAQHDFGNSFLKVTASNGALTATDYFAPFNTEAENAIDGDLGSGGPLLLPDQTDATGAMAHLMVGAGKDAHIYVVNRDNMGKFNAANNSQIVQDIAGALVGSEFGAPVYFNGTVYYGAVGDRLKAFPVTQARLATAPTSFTSLAFPYPGTTPSISANGTTNGIVWAAENGGTAVLHAYDATDLSKELYNSNQAANGRDHFGAGNKFITPMIANGKVYVPTTTGVGVFGMLK
jgi:outer membrane protein assembly factor BamB